MTLDEIRHQLSTARDIPKTALIAAVEQAEALLPETLRLMELASSHVMMTRPDERLLFYGVHALAAARRTELYDPLLRLIENRSHEIEWLLSGAPLHALLISSYAPGCRLPYDLLENLTIRDEVRSDLFLLMAWLVWQGHAPRDVFTAFLDRFDRDGSVDPDDFAWFGWQSAISLLGLNEFEERMRAGWEAGRMRHDRDVDREAWLAQLHQAERDGPISEEFAHYSAEPIRDIFVALRRIPFFGFGRITYSDEIDPSDPARDIRLMSDEWGWLELFLASETVPLDAMTVERLDGYLTALAIGPEAVPRAEWCPLIWSESGKEPEFQTESLEPYVNELIDRHFETIQRRLLTRYRHAPLVEAESRQEDVEEWAIGFSIGLDLRPGKWDRIAEHEHASMAFAAIAMLLPPEDLAGKVNLPEQTEDARNGMLDKLPDMIRQVYAFWRGQPVQPLFGPRRVQKIGRNDPCPCGSGRKYKKCCGAN